MPDPMRVYSPGDAARELGVTTQSLRRYAQCYAELFEPITQHTKQRVFTEEVVGRLQAAQVLQQANRAPSIKAALELIRDGQADAETLVEAQGHPDPLTVLAETVRALKDEIVALRGTVEAQGEQLKALGAPSSPPAEPDESLVAELERRNRYLEGELRRRDLEAEKPRRPWWWAWSKR